MAPSTMPRRRLGTIEEASVVLGVVPRTVRRLISRGELVAYRVGNTRVIRVDLDQVEGLLRPIATGGAA